jgi:hypothetical protein
MLASFIVFGGWIFWISVLALFVFEYQSVKRERGWNAFWALLVWFILLGAFGNVSFGQVKAFLMTKAGWWLMGEYAIVFLVCGVAWAIFRWVWRNAKRTRQVERHVADYLGSKKRKGTIIPDDLLEDWDNYVFGTQWLQGVQRLVNNARKAYEKLNTQKYQPDPSLTDQGWREILSQPNWNDLHLNVRGDLEQARKDFLTHYDMADAVEIPENMRSIWLRRVLEPVPSFYGQPEIAELSQEPLVMQHIDTLGFWMAWWFVDIVIFFLGDLIHEIWLFFIHKLRGMLQAIAHYQYRNVRKNFRTPFVAVAVDDAPKPEPVEEL